MAQVAACLVLSSNPREGKEGKNEVKLRTEVN
jgi:hypothetical protein